MKYNITENKHNIITLIYIIEPNNILEHCIKCLQCQKTDILLLLSDNNSKIYAENNNYNYIYIKETIDKQIQTGLNYIKNKYDYVMIINNNILLPSNWIKKGIEIIEKNDVDVVGTDKYYIYVDNIRYLRSYIKCNLTYLPYNLRSKWVFGLGRIIRRRILDKIEWILFDNNCNEQNLDKISGLKLFNYDAKFYVMDNYFISVNFKNLNEIKKSKFNKLTIIDKYENKEFEIIEKSIKDTIQCEKNYQILTIVYVFDIYTPEKNNVIMCCLDILQKQTIKTEILLWVMNNDDKIFAKENNLEYITSLSDLYSKIKKYDYLLLVQYNNILTRNFIEKCLDGINKYSIVEKDYYYIYDSISQKRYITKNLGFSPIKFLKLDKIIEDTILNIFNINNIDHHLKLKNININNIGIVKGAEILTIKISDMINNNEIKEIETYDKDILYLENKYNTIVKAHKLKSINKQISLEQERNLVSVIITVYNNEEDIINAIESVLLQTYQNFEIIIIDDCSTDNTYDIVKTFMEIYKDERIKLIRNEINMGTYISTNIGIQNTKGKYITKVDSDDKFHPTKIQKQVEILDNNNHYVGVTTLSQRNFTSRNPIIRIGEITLMFRREIIDKIGYYDSVRFGADAEFIHRIIKVYGENAIYHIPEILYIAKTRDMSLMTSEQTGYYSKRGKEIRLNYKKSYKEWYNTSDNLKIEFPLKERKFPVNPVML